MGILDNFNSLDADQRNFAVYVAAPFGTGILLQFLGCYLWSNWWPLLTAFCYVLAIMAHLFFGGDNSGGANPWSDAGKFLVGFSGVGTLAIPTVLYHAQKIALGTLWMEILSVLFLGFAIIAQQYLSEQNGGGFFTS